jgi:uncharacterized repeat protein (TIGR01451 family)
MKTSAETSQIVKTLGLQQHRLKHLSRRVVAGLLLGLGLHAQLIAATTANPNACDLSNFNVGLQSTGTGPFAGAPGATNGDDNSASDSIVRTNDVYVYRFNYKLAAGKLENNITFTSQLNLLNGKKVVVWDGLPPQCSGPGSSVSADGLLLTCNIGNKDQTTGGDLTAAVLAQAKATVYGANNQIINANVDVKTDACQAAQAIPQQPAPAVTISARQKVDFRKDVLYTQQQGYKFSSTSGGPVEDGYLVAWYVYMDQYDPAGASSKGGEAINSPITFNDVSRNLPPGSIWFDCYRTSGAGQGNISCPARYTPANDAVGGPGSVSPITITARPGEENEFMVAGGKNTDVEINPFTSQPQRLATFAVRFWVPLAAIQNPAYQTSSGQIDTNNAITGFSGTTISGTPVVDQLTTNNSLTNTLVATLPGSYYKYIARHWLGTNNWNPAVFGGTGGGTYQLDGTENWGDSGTALVYPGQLFFPRLDYYNPSAADTPLTPITNPGTILCENFDNTQVELAVIPGSGGHAAGWYYSSASNISYGAPGNANEDFPSGYKVEYGVSTTGSGNPGRNSYCQDTDAEWFDTVSAAEAAGKKDLLNKVRILIPQLGGGKNSLMVIAQKARPGINGTYLIDYTPYKLATVAGGAWSPSGYQSGPNATSPLPSGDNTGLSTGKRVQLTTSLVRVLKDADINGSPVSTTVAGGTVNYKLTPSLQSIINGLPATFITVVDRLPAPLAYMPGTSRVGGVLKEPDSIEADAQGTSLTWTLNNVIPNTTVSTVSFNAFVPETITPNSSVNNRVVVSSPDDSSPENQRQANKSLSVLNPPGLKVFKSTSTPLIEPNTVGKFKLEISNFENTPTTVEVIDVIPYNGDNAGVSQAPLLAQGGRIPPSNFAGTTPLTNTSVVAPAGATVRYSKKLPGTGLSNVLIDPNAAGNAATVADGWCTAAEIGTAPTCPATFAEVTAFRVSGMPLAANSTGVISLDMPTLGNTIGNIYTNRFGIRSSDPGFAYLRSNDVQIQVTLGSLSGKVYVDTDGSATQGAPGAEPPLQGVTVTLCTANPALTGGVCPPANVQSTTTTDAQGNYTFPNLPSKQYWIVETKPAGYANGPNNAAGSTGGTAGTNSFNAINLPIGGNGANYNFGHRLTDLATTVRVPASPVQPGAVLNATVTFSNVSQVPSENTTATIKVTPGLPGSSVVVTPPPGWAIISPYNPTTGEIQFAPTTPGATMTPGASVNFPVQITMPDRGAVTLTSQITNTIGDLTPNDINNPASTDPKRNAHQGVITVIPMQIDVRKRAGTPYQLNTTELETVLGVAPGGAGTQVGFAVPYRVTVANKNSITATNVQTSDYLPATFPSPATIVRVQQEAGSPTANITAFTPGALVTNGPSTSVCAASGSAFNGGSQANFLAGNFNLNPGQSCDIAFTVILTYPAAANVPAVAQKNTAWASASDVTNNGPTSFSASGTPTWPTGPGAPRAIDASTDTPQVPPGSPGDLPGNPGPGGSPSNADQPDPSPVSFAPQSIDVRKSGSTAVQLDLSGKRFRMAYTVNVTNTSASANATNVQLSENLKFTFPTPAVFTVTSVALATPAAGANTCVAGDLNSSFDGGKAYTGSNARNYNLLGTNGISSLALTPGQQCVISFSVEVDYGTGAVPTAPPENRIFGSTASGGNNDGPPFDPATGAKTGDNPLMINKDTSANVTPVTTVYGTAPADPGAPPGGAKTDSGSGTPAPIATLETVKAATGAPVAIAAGKYRIPYEVSIVARGSATMVLPNVQAIDNLRQAFDRGNTGVPAISVVPTSQTVAAISGAICPAGITTVDPANPGPTLRFFSGSTALTVGSGCKFNFFVELDYGSNAVVPGPHWNQVYATSIATGPNNGGSVALDSGNTSTAVVGGGSKAGTFTPPAGTLIAHDASTNGNTLPTASAGDRPVPTPVQLTPPPTIDAVKYARNLTRPGAQITTGDLIEWTVIYKNSSANQASGVQVTDARQPGYSSATLVSAVRVPDNSLEPIQPNTGFNGTTDKNLLFDVVNMAPGDQLVFKINMVVSATVPANVTNQANLSATELGGPGGTLVPTSAVDKGITQVCPSANTCLSSGVTVPNDTITSTTATPGTKGQPNTLPVIGVASLSGKVYLDKNTNGVYDPATDSTPFGTVSIALCKTNSTPCPTSDIFATTTTNVSGDYAFSNVPPGTFYIVETQPTGYGSSSPNVRPVTMAGTSITDQNFGETAGSISGRVYRDNDGSGTPNAADVGITGVTVKLCLSNDTLCANPVTTTVTVGTGASGGTYTFADLPAPPAGQTYYILEDQTTVPAGLNNGTTTVGSLQVPAGAPSVAGTANSTASRINGITWTPLVTPSTQPAATGTAYDFGELPTSTVSGKVFIDKNFDGVDNGADSGLPGTTTVTLCRSNPAHGSPCPAADVVQTTATTPGSGTYSFNNVLPGNYYVVETQPAGYGSSSPNTSGVVNVSGGTNVTGINFAETGAQISGVVYKDANYDGALTAADLRLPNVTVRICTSPTCSATNTTTIVATAVTNASGTYTFADLPAPPAGQQYYIVEDQSTVAQPSAIPLFDGTSTLGSFTTNGVGATANPGTVNQTPSRMDGITFTPASAVLTGNPSVIGQNFNFGEIEGVNLSGRVYYDKDRNGVQGNPSIDTGIQSVTITLCRVATQPCTGANIVGTTTTNITGDYSFARVPPGNYFVQETQPSGYGSTPTTAAPSSTDVRPVTVGVTDVVNVNFADTLGSLAGLVYVDRDGSQTQNGTETAVVTSGPTPTRLPGVTITLTGTDASGAPVTRTTVTDSNGNYKFEDLKQGTYVVTETQPVGYGNGASHPGSTGGAGRTNSNVISAIALPAAGDSINNNFGDVPKSGVVSGSIWLDNNHDGKLSPNEPLLPGWTVVLLRVPPENPTAAPMTISSVVSPGGTYTFPPQEVGPGYSLRFIAPTSGGGTSTGAIFGGAVNGEQGTPVPQGGGSVVGRGELTQLTLKDGINIPQQSLPVDPSGVVYDTDTRLPIAGATVRFEAVNCPTYDPAIHLVGGAGNATQVTGPDGFYQYLLNPGAPRCEYRVVITPPAGYTLDGNTPPQTTRPYQARPPAICPIVPNNGAPQGSDPTTYHTNFIISGVPGQESCDIVNNHIPLVAANRPVLFITKVANKTTAELGDTVRYTVEVRYAQGNAPLPSMRVIDNMPAGFRLINGTVFVANPSTAAPVALPAANIVGAPGSQIVYNLPAPVGGFAVGSVVRLTYIARLGVGSMQGDGINRAQAASIGVVRSNVAQARVRVTGGVFTNDGCVTGKVYLDCNNNHMQDAEELGVPGVRLYFNDGTYMISDAEGKYSICGLEPKSYVLKVDQLTLPRGSRLTTTSNRNLGNGDSLWIDLKNGEMQQADFAIGSCSNTVLEQIKARRTQGGVRSVETERKGGPALKFEGKSPAYPDQGTDSANQPLVRPRSPGQPPGNTDAENNTPVHQLPASSGSTQGGNLREAK